MAFKKKVLTYRNAGPLTSKLHNLYTLVLWLNSAYLKQVFSQLELFSINLYQHVF